MQHHTGSFCDQAWERNLLLFQATLDLPFNRELAAGTLPRDVFRHYMIQDAHYLVAFGRALAAAAAKADDADGVVQFAAAAQEAVVAERELHHSFMREYAITPEEFASTPLSPTCHHYCHFLQSVAWSRSYPVALAALLPCFWIYAEVGVDLQKRTAAGNPYQSWIDTYGGEDFHAHVHAVRNTIDAVAAQADTRTLAEMHAAYTDAARLEWMFWDSAYRMQTWAC
ncbi:thiaminase II [Comamonas kerstersii]|uniref:Aminopyrimidine aminohydrolase n=1 Tax=Comamonas kerstersii TaxID=225992 RepID=A0A6A1R6I9_9BURK|nr:thiaminase II [Comamonas kerstersii]KAB0588658.1 thiaminase II [Comamonas kerstersii]